MFVGDVGPMSRMRKPCSDLRNLSKSFHALECLGIRGPVRTVGLPGAGVPGCVLPKRLRITSSVFDRRPVLPAGNMLIIFGPSSVQLVVGWRGCDRNLGALRRSNTTCLFALQRFNLAAKDSLLLYRQASGGDVPHQIAPIPQFYSPCGRYIANQMPQEDYISCRYVRSHMCVGAYSEAAFQKGNCSLNM